MATISQIVGEYMLETGEGEAKKIRLMQMAISGLREFHLDLVGESKTVKISRSAVDTLDLPQDYLQMIKIGVLINGNIYQLGINPAMSLTKSYDDCGDEELPATTANEGQPLSTDYSANHFRNGEVTGAFFGLGGGNNVWGYYKIDLRSWQIRLQGCSADELLLEYLPNLEKAPVDGRDQYSVPDQCIEALKNWIYWKSIQRNRSYSLGEKQIAEQNWTSSYYDARARMQPIRYNELLQAWRTHNTQTARF